LTLDTELPRFIITLGIELPVSKPGGSPPMMPVIADRQSTRGGRQSMSKKKVGGKKKAGKKR
jgi:hypothetical protein